MMTTNMIKSAINPHSKLFNNKQLNPNRISYNDTNIQCPNKPSFISPLICCSQSRQQNKPLISHQIIQENENDYYEFRTEVGSPSPIITTPIKPSSFSNLFAFFACTTCVAFTSFVIAAVPMLHAMSRAAISFSKLADTAREELPSTMAAIRLSGMEISDLTLELSDLSQEITAGVNKSAQVVQAAEAGIRQMGSRAHQQTMSMIEERANLPDLSLQPVVVEAAKKTSQAVGRATKSLMNMISKGDSSPEDEKANAIERLEI